MNPSLVLRLGRHHPLALSGSMSKAVLWAMASMALASMALSVYLMGELRVTQRQLDELESGLDVTQDKVEEMDDVLIDVSRIVFK